MKNSIKQSLLLIAVELDSLLKMNKYAEFGDLMRSSTPLFKYALDKNYIIINKEMVGDDYEETFNIVGFDEVFSLHIIGPF